LGTYSDTAKNQMLEAQFRNVALQNASVYVKLHTGDPGSAGTSNAATETTRQVVTFAAAASGSIASNAAVTWTNVSTTETYSWVSLWTASSGGTFLGRDDLPSSKSVTAGDTFQINSGDLTLSIT
jgi:hypothetical protein